MLADSALSCSPSLAIAAAFEAPFSSILAPSNRARARCLTRPIISQLFESATFILSSSSVRGARASLSARYSQSTDSMVPIPSVALCIDSLSNTYVHSPSVSCIPKTAEIHCHHSFRGNTTTLCHFKQPQKIPLLAHGVKMRQCFASSLEDGAYERCQPQHVAPILFLYVISAAIDSLQ